MQNVYRVTHKSGLVEILTGSRSLYDLKIPTQIVNPLGYTLKLDWDYETYTMPRLVTVSDESEKQVLLKIQYKTAFYTRITVWPGSSESYDIQLLFENDKVTQIINLTSNQTLIWKLEYDSDSGFLIRVSSPTGTAEFVDYDFDGHQFPEEAALTPLPYVTRYTQQIKQSPDVIRHYEYTEFNFLGYGSNESWNDDEDYLYGVLTNYHYGSIEHWDNGREQRHITRRYNNYHLLISETVRQNGCQRQHETKYYTRIGQTFDEQPPQFQLPQSATVRFISDSRQREEVTQTEFDAAGNPTVQIASDGTRTTWAYYPAEGEADKCPADPHGFVRYVKSKTIIPPPAEGYDDAPVHQVIYHYDPLSTRPGSLTDYAVVCVWQGGYSDGQLLHASQTRYVDKAESPHHGRVASIEETVYSVSDAGSAATDTHWTSQKTFSYTLKEGKLRRTMQWRGHDGLTAVGTQVKSCFSGKVSHEQDPLGCTAHYDYDDVGRLLKQVNNAHTRYAQTTQYAYTIEQPGAVTTTQQDVWGNQARIRFDGLGRLCHQEILVRGQEARGWCRVFDTEYDSWGRIVVQNHHDWLSVGTDPEQVEPVSIRQQTTYDNWGQLCQITDGPGKRVRQDYDPVTRTIRSTMEADGLRFGHTETVFDLRHQPLTVTQYDSHGKQASQQQYHYDGLGRLRATVDELKQKTEYTYDVFNRVSTVRYSDGTVVRKRYAPFSADSLLMQIDADGKVLGQREFDSLHRVTATTVGGRTHLATYQGSLPAPEMVTDPLGQTVHYQYEPRLGNVLLQMTAPGIKQHFTYDARTGAMAQAVAAQQTSHAFKYTSAGQLQQETVRFDDPGAGAARNTEYIYSPAGKLTAYRDVTGKIHRLRFDTLGRPVETTDEAISVTCRYDTASRMHSWTVHDRENAQQLTTTLTWDDFGREIGRRIETGTEVLTLAQTYTITGQLASRITRSQQAGLLRQESYIYDTARRWLTEYQCEGAECPQDAYGMLLTRQQFTYDRLGNILTCVTTLSDGSRDTATFSYSLSDPCQLQQITHTHPEYPAVITLAYDKAGRLIRDEVGRELIYDALGRLASVTLKDNASRYGYDAAGRLVLQQLGSEQTHELYYQGSVRVVEVLRESGAETRLVQANGAPAATLTGRGAYLLGTDGQGSVLMSQQNTDTLARHCYTPYGQQAAEARNPALPAYTGERSDPVGGGYHLGNGYRTYNPVLMRFTAPDSLSPFGAGGLNPYAYCLGDPINRSDPSGHMSLGSILGIVFGTIGLIGGLAAAIPTGGASLSIGAAILAGVGFLGDATGIASAATEESNPQASAVLGWVAFGLGAMSLGSTLLGGLARGMRLTGERLTGSFAQGLSGKRSVRETGYVHAFREIKNLAGRDIVETIGNSQINNIEVNLATISDRTQLPKYRSMFEHLLKLGFVESPPGSNIYRIDNTVPMSNVVSGQSTHVNITNDIYLRLYAQFITGNSTVTHITLTNSLRSIIDAQVASRTHFTDTTMLRMQRMWGFTGYSGTFKDWIVTEMTLRFSTREQDIRALADIIQISDTISFRVLYNNFI
ncbi:RHS repeat domain-containing protein [Xenorhabdus hominickii]|uniref:RHS repeat domain-containing protein n=1 Tax=Xenorhabdus hominickii TaxID=351679 RepID=UPI0018DD8B33|nr:RHS repeat-associated core domain-containing protein [Xenorhabdus hominickii]